MPFCPRCGRNVQEDERFCSSCGYDLKQSTGGRSSSFEPFKKCPYCGGEMIKGGIGGAAWYPIDTGTKVLGVLSPTRKLIDAYMCHNCGYIVLKSREK